MRTHSLPLVSALALLAILACNTGGLQSTTQSGRLNVYLTDAPLGDVASATVTISKVYLIGGSDESGSRFTVTDTPQDYDLLTLQDGVTATLFNELTTDAVVDAIARADALTTSPDQLAAAGRRFSADVFRERMREVVSRALADRRSG